MRRTRKVVKWMLLIMLVVTVTAGASGYVYLRRSLPRLEGSVEVAGLGGPVEVMRDVDGVPHIYAQSHQDALFGLGYVHAQDRLWQMEFQRRLAQGRLSEVMGPATLAQDRFLRTLGVYRASVSAWEPLPAETKGRVNAYVAGINAFLAGNHGSRLPLEFTVLGFAPEPWSGPDVLAWIKMMAFSLGGDAFQELYRSDLIKQVGPERARDLLPETADDGPVVVGAWRQEASYGELRALEGQVRALLGASGVQQHNIGSNSWVVDGTRTASGKPLLANDPHLETGAPAIWYLAHLSAPGFEVVGATVPGLPAVIVGRNQALAWGMTNLIPDAQDFFRERLDPTGTLVEFRGALEPLRQIAEVVKVKGQPDVALQVRVSRHGPLISDALNANARELPPDVPAERRPAQLEPLALSWVALGPEDASVEAFLQINLARDWSEFTGALRHHVAPALSFTYADAQGNIGYYAAGRIPIRARPNGGLPVEGWAGGDEWTGAIPFAELPHSYNPPEHMIVSANNRPVAADYPYFLGRGWAPHYRAQRITELLQAGSSLSADDYAAIQGDTVSLQARELTPLLLVLVEPRDALGQQAVALLKGWDYDARGASAAAAIFESWLARIQPAIVGDELGPTLADGYVGHRFFTSTLADPASPWCDDTSTAAPESCRDIAQQTLAAVLGELQAAQGPEVAAWRWDRLHTVVFAHQPFDNVPILQGLFSRAAPAGGDVSTVNLGEFGSYPPYTQRVAASYRQIVDLADTNGGRFIQALGQSGHRLSPHYDDYLDDWLAIRYRPMRLERRTVEPATAATLTLTPAR